MYTIYDKWLCLTQNELKRDAYIFIVSQEGNKSIRMNKMSVVEMYQLEMVILPTFMISEFT